MNQLDIIWNITSVCMWDCGVCCVDATHVKAKQGKIYIRSDNLEKLDVISNRQETGNIFEQALAYRIAAGLELSLEDKFKVLEHLQGYPVKIDFSGGDPLSVRNTMVVMKKASEMFGQENITLTATGAGLHTIKAEELQGVIGELNFTYDSTSSPNLESRPKGYANSNIKKAAQFAKTGIKIRGETPLTIDNIQKETLTRIYLDLHNAGASIHLIMRLFPSGRGVCLQNKTPSTEQYQQAINWLYELEAKYTFPKVKLQCALKFLDKNKRYAANPCDMVKNSFGLMPNGTLLASPWAIGNQGKPVNDIFVLGNLAKENLKTILNSSKAKNFIRKADENFGHCKIQAYFSKTTGGDQLIFSKADPLYASN